ncbi:MAG TPA: hypothetical protein PKL53_06680 [Methylotenera sp.]|nr:hypothetical protein [Methylotenera sp.]HPV44136.1 hypothetical protein [Methylotenera sp.]
MGKIPKWVIKAFFGLVFAAFFFLAGSLYQWLDIWFRKPVEVTITNDSGQDIKSLNLAYTGYLTSGVINIKPPSKNQSVLVKYYQSGEGSFSIEATLENGKILRGKEGYVEAGYSIDKTITSEEIKGEIGSLGY